MPPKDRLMDTLLSSSRVLSSPTAGTAFARMSTAPFEVLASAGNLSWAPNWRCREQG